MSMLGQCIDLGRHLAEDSEFDETKTTDSQDSKQN